MHVEKSRQVVFSLFSQVDTRSCHSQEEKQTNIILNDKAEALNQPVYIEINGSDCLCMDT